MLLLPGSPALSDFRLRKLLSTIQSAVSQVQRLQSRFLHLADLAAELTAHEQHVLKSLLTYGPREESADQHDHQHGQLILVLPRLGTISPWAS